MRCLWFFALVFVGCSNPAAVEVGCTDLNLSPLAGQWQETKTQRGHEYRLDLEIWVDDNDPCRYHYLYQTHIVAHEGQDTDEKIYELLGEMIIVDARSDLGILILTFESRRLYQWAVGADGNVHRDDGVFVHNRGQAKIWDGILVVWSDQFKKVE